MDCLLSEASQWCGHSHTRGTSRHAEKTNNLWSKAHRGRYFPQVLYNFYAQIERCRTEDKILFQNLNMKKIHIPQGTNQQLQADTDTLYESCPDSCLSHCTVQWRVGDGTRLPALSSTALPAQAKGLLFAMAVRPTARAHSGPHRNSCLLFGKKKKSKLKPTPVQAHCPDKQ